MLQLLEIDLSPPRNTLKLKPPNGPHTDNLKQPDALQQEPTLTFHFRRVLV